MPSSLYLVLPLSFGHSENGKPRRMRFRREGGELVIHVLRWNGRVEIIRVPAGVARLIEIPSGGFFSMTVRTHTERVSRRKAT